MHATRGRQSSGRNENKVSWKKATRHLVNLYERERERERERPGLMPSLGEIKAT